MKLNAVIKYSLGENETPFFCKNFIFSLPIVNPFTYKNSRIFTILNLYLVNIIYMLCLLLRDLLHNCLFFCKILFRNCFVFLMITILSLLLQCLCCLSLI